MEVDGGVVAMVAGAVLPGFRLFSFFRPPSSPSRSSRELAMLVRRLMLEFGRERSS